MTARAFAVLLVEVWRLPRNRRHLVRLCLVAYLEVAAGQLRTSRELADLNSLKSVNNLKEGT